MWLGLYWEFHGQSVRVFMLVNTHSLSLLLHPLTFKEEYKGNHCFAITLLANKLFQLPQ